MTAPITPEAIREHAGQFIQGVERLSGTRLAFEVASLAELDSWLAEWIDMASVYDAPTAQADTALAEPIAAYVGEVLVRTAGAGWEFDATGDHAFPPLRFVNGRRIDLHAVVITVLQRTAPPAFRRLAQLATEPT